MSWFGRKSDPKPEPPVTCPICQCTLASDSERRDHWTSHVERIPEGHGDATGQYTWACECGHAQMKWPKSYKAAAFLEYHLHRVHGIESADGPTMDMAVGSDPNYAHFKQRLS